MPTVRPPLDVALGKVRRRILPLIVAAYVVCYVDRTNIPGLLGQAGRRDREPLHIGGRE